MKRFAAVSAFAVALGITHLAQAAQLLSPPLPTSVGNTAVCYVRNTGSTKVKVQVSVFSNNSPVVTFDNCNESPLLPGHTCLVDTNVPDDSYVACSVTAPNVSKLRGTLELREISFNPIRKVLVSEDLK